MRAILIDDERPALEELAFILSDIGVEVLGSYTDPLEGLMEIKSQEPDVVFLDISMPQMDGFAVAKEMINLELSTQIVFATAYDEHAIHAFEINAVDYLLKPIEESRVVKTLARLEKNKPAKGSTSDRAKELHNLLKPKAKKFHKLPVWKNDRIYLLDKKEISYCYVESGQLNVVTQGQEYYMNESLSKLEEILGDEFYRCHRSYLINMELVEEIIPWFNNTFVVKLTGSKNEIPISRRHLKEFKELLGIG